MAGEKWDTATADGAPSVFERSPAGQTEGRSPERGMIWECDPGLMGQPEPAEL